MLTSCHVGGVLAACHFLTRDLCAALSRSNWIGLLGGFPSVCFRRLAARSFPLFSSLVFAVGAPVAEIPLVALRENRLRAISFPQVRTFDYLGVRVSSCFLPAGAAPPRPVHRLLFGFQHVALWARHLFRATDCSAGIDRPVLGWVLFARRPALSLPVPDHPGQLHLYADEIVHTELMPTSALSSPAGGTTCGCSLNNLQFFPHEYRHHEASRASRLASLLKRLPGARPGR